ncbi:YbhB/YbcL family Raf kinase inhibitor-like protein [Spongiactinospora rosea]|uniref:YbhB/YbcL family Raf kinase inhibitor-like protein n=1 Tax=Spongiactinospora rosea TaxID=2248750 RepID=UPI0018F75CE2|nr:YbhB/YbcL family Raf kinase inhibitor-like protein [Spongiactinospora rosea]
MTIRRVVSHVALAVCAAAAAIAAASPATANSGANRAAFTITSSAFAQGGTIPIVHECTSARPPDSRKKNESVPLAWSDAPAGAQSYAIIMRDLSNNNLLHWIIYDIPVSTTSLPQNVAHLYQPPVPAGSRQIYYRGSASLWGYQGPCSPSSINTYEFRVHALNRATLTELNQNSSIRTAAQVIANASLGSARITGLS